MFERHLDILGGKGLLNQKVRPSAMQTQQSRALWTRVLILLEKPHVSSVMTGPFLWGKYNLDFPLCHFLRLAHAFLSCAHSCGSVRSLVSSCSRSAARQCRHPEQGYHKEVGLEDSGRGSSSPSLDFRPSCTTKYPV